MAWFGDLTSCTMSNNLMMYSTYCPALIVVIEGSVLECIAHRKESHIISREG